MSTVTTTTAAPANVPAIAPKSLESQVFSYIPLAESDPIELTMGMVANMLAVKTATGKIPSRGDCLKFLVMCKARRLNPFVSDAYMIGYDTSDGPKFEIITAIQALRKRAEPNPNYDGTRKGVIVKIKTGENAWTIEKREGAMTYDNEVLLGGWSDVYRKDRSVPEHAEVKFSTYNTGKSRWAKDPAGMIVKCAEAAGLRAAFPSDLAGLYIAEEFDAEQEGQRKPAAAANGTAAKLAELAAKPEPGARTAKAKHHAEPEDRNAEAVADAAATAEITEAEQAEPEAPTDRQRAASALKRGEFESQLSRAMKITDVDATMTLAKSCKDLLDGDYDALNDKAEEVAANINAAEEGKL